MPVSMVTLETIAMAPQEVAMAVGVLQCTKYACVVLFAAGYHHESGFMCLLYVGI